MRAHYSSNSSLFTNLESFVYRESILKRNRVTRRFVQQGNCGIYLPNKSNFFSILHRAFSRPEDYPLCFVPTCSDDDLRLRDSTRFADRTSPTIVAPSLV